MRTLLTVTSLSWILGGSLLAQTPAPAQNPQEPAPAAKKLDEKLYDHFGTGITEGKNVAVADALKNPADYTGKTVRLEGNINEVCQTKGCWMYLGDPKNPVMVKFKDYAFFVPKDAAGRTAIIEGTMAMKQETVEQTKHYLEDAGKHEEAKKVTEGRRIYTFMASGVALSKPQPKKLDEKLYDHFGTGITEGKNVAVADALKNPAEYTGKTVRLEGSINEVCQTKGCWMYLGDPKNPVMVKFKDYAFFVPKDAAGRTAIVEGTMAMKQETVEQTKHYLEDAGKHEEAKKVTEGRRIYTFMASGVALSKPQSKDEQK